MHKQSLLPVTLCIHFLFSGPECNYSSFFLYVHQERCCVKATSCAGGFCLFFSLPKRSSRILCGNDLHTCVFQDTCPQPHEASKPSSGPAVSMTINRSLGAYPSTTIVNPTIVLLQHNRGKMKAPLLPGSYFARNIIW